MLHPCRTVNCGVIRCSKTDLPKLRLLLDELPQRLLAFRIIETNDLNTSRLQILFSSHVWVIHILPKDDSLDSIEQARTSAHVTGRERGEHGGTLILGCWDAAAVVEGGRFGLLEATAVSVPALLDPG